MSSLPWTAVSHSPCALRCLNGLRLCLSSRHVTSLTSRAPSPRPSQRLPSAERPASILSNIPAHTPPVPAAESVPAEDHTAENEASNPARKSRTPGSIRWNKEQRRAAREAAREVSEAAEAARLLTRTNTKEILKKRAIGLAAEPVPTAASAVVDDSNTAEISATVDVPTASNWKSTLHGVPPDYDTAEKSTVAKNSIAPDILPNATGAPLIRRFTTLDPLKSYLNLAGSKREEFSAQSMDGFIGKNAPTLPLMPQSSPKRYGWNDLRHRCVIFIWGTYKQCRSWLRPWYYRSSAKTAALYQNGLNGWRGLTIRSAETYKAARKKAIETWRWCATHIEHFAFWIRSSPRHHYGPRSRMPDLFVRRDTIYFHLAKRSLRWRLPPPKVYHDMFHVARCVASVEQSISYKFNNGMLCTEALKLTGFSFPIYWEGAIKEVVPNNRLALLGDRVLSLAICDIWFRTGNSNKEYARMDQDVTTRAALATKGYALGFHQSLLLPNSSKVASGDMIAETFEAILGAVYVDAGDDLEAVKRVVKTIGLDEHPLLRVSEKRKKNYEGLASAGVGEGEETEVATSEVTALKFKNGTEVIVPTVNVGPIIRKR